MKNLLPLFFAVIFGIASFLPAPASAYRYHGRYYHITTEAITTDIATKGITTSISIAGTTIGTGLGLSASLGVPGIIAIGERIDARSAVAIP